MINNAPNDLERLFKGLGQTPRARPGRDLMPGIKARIERQEVAAITAREWRAMAAAAVLLLLLNVTALNYYCITTGQDQATALVSDYQLYE